MRIYREKDYQAVSKRVADIIAAQLMLKPNSVLGLATGSTPVGAYQRLIELAKAGVIDFSNVSTVNLDEYLGLPGSNDQSYAYFMREKLFSHVNIDPAKVNIPDGTAPDPKAEARRYDQLIQNLGGIDLQLLGIGRNGHIGFNEPADSFQNDTHVVDLTESTILANQRFFAHAEEVPRQAITMGIGSIVRAKRVVMAASGKDKAEAIREAFTGPVIPQMPSSILQLHPDVILVADEEALSLMS